MGQFMSTSCVDCDSVLTTQEDVMHESSKMPIRKLREIIESMQEEEIIEFESPKHKQERLTTQLSYSNISSSRETYQSLITQATYQNSLPESKSLDCSLPSLATSASPSIYIYKKSSNNPFIRTPRVKCKTNLFSQTIDGDLSDNSLSYLNCSYRSNIKKYKTRSKNFSTVSENLVETLRSSPLPRKSSAA